MSKRFGFFGVMIAGFVGLVTGLLTAPKAGKETREDLREKTDELKGRAGKALTEASEKATEVKERAGEKAQEVRGKAEEVTTEAKRRAEAIGSDVRRRLHEEEAPEASKTHTTRHSRRETK